MIFYLPEIYPDELVYSWFCRYFVHSGFLTHNAALRSLYCKRSNNPSKEFLGQLNQEALSVIKQILPIKSLILQHTMFPQYARFVPKQQKKTALECMCNDFCDAHHLFSVLPRSETDVFLKYCPLCAKEDRDKYGETYWHKSHQIRGVMVCHNHKCVLESSEVPAKSELSYTFCSAEEYTLNKTPIFTDNVELIKYIRYLNNVFNVKLDFEAGAPIQSILYHAMKDTKYMKSNGKMRNTKLLTDDITVFYECMGVRNIASFNQIQRVLLGERFEFSVVCQIAYYLGISEKALTTPQVTEEEIKCEQDTHYMKKKAKTNWVEYDASLLPVLERLVKDKYYGTTNKNGRPERVSERSIYRELGLLCHRLEVLPRCRAMLDNYLETYEENWARRIIWAYNKIKTDKKRLCWTNIRSLSGVKKKNIEKVIPIIVKYADNITSTELLSVLQK